MLRLAGLLLALFGLALPAGAATPHERIVAIGDLHGDYHAWVAITRAAGLSDQRGRWRGGRTTLVQMGDIVDRGPDSLKILTQLQHWQREARRAGGQVIVLVGNHEAMMMTADLRYVHPGEYAAFVNSRSAALRERTWESNRDAFTARLRAAEPTLAAEAIKARWMAEVPLGMIELRRAWAPTGPLGRWLIEQPAVVKVGDTLFVHGGIPAEIAPLGITEINRQVRAALEAQDQAPESIINRPLGPLWYRGHVLREADPEQKAVATAPAAARPGIAQELDLVLRTLGASRLVIGHTPSLRGIISEQGGRLIRIDSGISAYYGGPLTWLEIRGPAVTNHSVPRPTESRR